MASDAVRQALTEILDKHSFDDCGDCDCGVAAEVRGGTQGHHLAEQVMPVVLAAEAAAIEECAKAADESQYGMYHSAPAAVFLHHAVQAIRSLLTPARKSALEAKMLEARIAEADKRKHVGYFDAHHNAATCELCLEHVSNIEQRVSLRKENL